MPCRPAGARACGDLCAESGGMPDQAAGGKGSCRGNIMRASAGLSDRAGQRTNRDHLPEPGHFHDPGQGIYPPDRKPEPPPAHGRPVGGIILCCAGYHRVPPRGKMDRGDQRPVDGGIPVQRLLHPHDEGRDGSRAHRLLQGTTGTGQVCVRLCGTEAKNHYPHYGSDFGAAGGLFYTSGLLEAHGNGGHRGGLEGLCVYREPGGQGKICPVQKDRAVGSIVYIGSMR